MRFATANSAALKALPPLTASSPGEGTAALSGASVLFRLLLCEQIPAQQGEAAAPDTHPQFVAESVAGKSHAPLPSPATMGPKSGAHPKACTTAEPFPAAEASADAQATPVHGFPGADKQPDAGLAADTAKDGNSLLPELPNPLSGPPAALADALTENLAGNGPLGVESTPTALLPDAAMTPGHAEPPRVEEEPNAPVRSSTPKDKHSEAAEKPNEGQADRRPSISIGTGALPPPLVSATAAAPAVPGDVPSAMPPKTILPAGSAQGRAPARVQASRKPVPSALLNTTPQPGPTSAAGIPANPLHETAGEGAPAVHARRAPMHDVPDEPAAAAPLHPSEMNRSAASLQNNAPHMRIPAGPALAPAAGPQTAPSTQAPALTHAAIPTHASTASSDLSLRPAGALERMDAAAPPRVLESSPQNLAVGIRDAGLGWVEIRTHAVAGQVSATLASGTHESHAAIAAALPEIRDTLVNQHVALHSLSAERFPSSSGGGAGGHAHDSAPSPRSSFVRRGAGLPSAHNEPEGDSLSYISVRV